MERLLTDVVMATHFAYLAYLAVGGFLAWRWRWRWTIYPHLAAVAWALGIVLVGFPCPLTSIERRLRGEAGDFGFIDRYLEEVVYPEEFTTVLRLAVAVVVAFAYWGCFQRRASQTESDHRVNRHAVLRSG